jgi:hypothetical protein
VMNAFREKMATEQAQAILFHLQRAAMDPARPGSRNGSRELSKQEPGVTWTVARRE